MRTVSRHRVGALASLTIALAVALLSVATISVFPPGVHSRSHELAAASTELLVDTPRSLLADVREDAEVLESFADRAVLLGNVMARGQVRAHIAQRVGIPANALIVEAPLTPSQPRARRVEPDSEKHVTDILASPDQYRLSIQADPTVPLLDIYTEAPTTTSAAALANSAVDGLRAYGDQVAKDSGTPVGDQLHLVQLGRAEGEVINGGANPQIAGVAFLLSFAACCVSLVYLDRVRAGWRMASRSEKQTPS